MTELTPPHPVLEEYYRVPADRHSFVGDLFDGAARYYNHIGRMLDLGSGPMYRRQALQRAGLKKGMRLLDVATGTGLVARGGVAILGDPRRVIGVDPSVGMLREARLAVTSPLTRGRAESLPFRADTSTCSAWALPCATSTISRSRSASTGACSSPGGVCSCSRCPVQVRGFHAG